MTFNQIVTVILTTLLTAAVGAFVGILRRYAKTIQQTIQDFECLKTSQRAMIRDRIVQAHDYFCNKGTIGKYSLATLEDLFREYVQLGGNSFVAGMMDDIRALPVH